MGRPSAFRLRFLLPVLIVSCILSVTGSRIEDLPIRLETKRAIDSRLSNIHVSCRAGHVDCEKSFKISYGPCDANSSDSVHHVIGGVHTFPSWEEGAEARLAWLIPEDAEGGGCLSAWESSASVHGLKSKRHSGNDMKSADRLLGRSDKLLIFKKHRQWRKAKRNLVIPMNNASGIDAEGPWFDGVELLKHQEPKMVDVKSAKSKSQYKALQLSNNDEIAIVGAGMGGLMTWLCLHSSGFSNIEIIEAGERLGGRVHTQYLEGGPFDYQYQEMGPMRFPETIQYLGSNESLPINDMKFVFQLGDKLNVLNDFNSNFSVDFIPWIQNSENGLYYFDGIKKPNGLPPTVADVAANPQKWTMEAPTPEKLTELQVDYTNIAKKNNTLRLAAKNMFLAHKKYLDVGLDGLGGDNWSEFSYFHNYLKYSLKITDEFLSSSGRFSDEFWSNIYDNVYFGSTTWKTIDGGLNRLPYAFYPLVSNITKMSRSISALSYSKDTDKVTLSWKDSLLSSKRHNATYDYAMVAVPFNLVKSWRFPNTSFNPTLTDAISNVPYKSACKVALQFKTRFWEHYEKPIIGSCSTMTDIPGIGSVCYPSYNLHAPGPGVMLGSYIPGAWADYFLSMTEKEHVQYVLDVMIEIHGDVARQQYTGKYARRCWTLDPLEGAAWTSPEAGMHKLYIPEYFKTENNVIFVGEHTSYTHAWISSALESAVRGSVQLMLGMGLVDEAKAITEEWMGRWISV